jgi:hypothetical protein
MSITNLGPNVVDSTNIVLAAGRRMFGYMIQGARETAGRSVEEAARLAAIEPSASGRPIESPARSSTSSKYSMS